jgi:hypothetical protein
MAIGKVVVYSCIKLIMKELKNSVDQVRVVTTLNICWIIHLVVGATKSQAKYTFSIIDKMREIESEGLN